MNKNNIQLIQLVCACLGVVVGHGLLIAGFIVAPTGDISNSTLIAYGETITFAASLFGVDYHYRYSATPRGRAKQLPDDAAADSGAGGTHGART